MAAGSTLKSLLPLVIVSIFDNVTKSSLATIRTVKKQNTTAALNKLNAFINDVKAQKGKKIPENTAELLIQYAQHVIYQIQAM